MSTDFVSKIRSLKTVQRAEPLLGLALGRRKDFFIGVLLDVLLFLGIQALLLWLAWVLQLSFALTLLHLISEASPALGSDPSALTVPGALQVSVLLFGSAFCASFWGCQRHQPAYLLQHSALSAAAACLITVGLLCVAALSTEVVTLLTGCVLWGNFAGYRVALRLRQKNDMPKP